MHRDLLCNPMKSVVSGESFICSWREKMGQLKGLSIQGLEVEGGREGEGGGGG